MNHEDTEYREKSKRTNKVNLSRDSVIIGVFILISVFVLWLISVTIFGFNYTKWKMTNIDNYNLYLSQAELLEDTPYLESKQYLFYDEQGELRIDYPAKVFTAEYEAVPTLFSIALKLAINPFDGCRLYYDDEYGFPKQINCGQWNQILVLSFEITN